MQKYDIIGIGFGPSNIALAIQCKSLFPNLKIKFFDKNVDSIWQKEMLIDNSDIQHNPLRDLVTIVDPRSKYSFINFLFLNNRLHPFLNSRLYFPLRIDYAEYINWCAKDFLSQVNYKEEVLNIKYTEDNKNIKVSTKNGVYQSHYLVIGSGRTPNIPNEFRNIYSSSCFHFTKYMSSIKKLNNKDKYNFTVVGSSQSAVEIILDLAKKFPNSNITCIIRNFSFKLKETSPFSYEVYFPDNIDYFYNLSTDNRKKVLSELWGTNYSSVDDDVLKELYIKLYINKISNNETIKIIKNAIIYKAESNENKIIIHYKDKYSNDHDSVKGDITILATGFKNEISKDNPMSILSSVIDNYKTDNDGILHVNRDYSLEPVDKSMPNIYLSGLCELSHGIGDAGSFGTIPIRAKTIVRSIVNKNNL